MTLVILNMFTIIINHQNILSFLLELNNRANELESSGTASAYVTMLSFRFFLLGIALVFSWIMCISFYWKSKERL